MNINLELYKVFYYVATTLSFSEASTKLFISQSAVSQSIKTLEKNLNTTLFNRNTKRVTLTHEGSLLLQHIEPAINLIHNGENNIMETRSLNQGKIHIGASDTICKYILLPYFKKFHSVYPNIHLQVTNRTSIKCVDLLKQGNVDFIVTNLPNRSIGGSLEVKEFYKFNDIFIGGNDFIELKDKRVSLKELIKYPLLMLEKNTTTSQYINEVFESKGLVLSPEIELTSIDLLVELAKINLGISLVPDYCMDEELLKDVFEIKTREVLSDRSLGIVSKKNIPLSIAGRKFVDFILE
ncbi:LysR family transcriptional regulator [Vallitalea sp.]|jgi:DNA-binding transcriptional LysR family regulator|uniref:LysR family transcriptional regulator n=1 Tax=Vallitalea sp. TaxID=1882829 RepID=UPI0025DE4734|nr:LysR family transcriptional regulator [Vallitalea sp.]MCT4687777.1 LysR family transcriptional regulator [Vallitalea sp.]